MDESAANSLYVPGAGNPSDRMRSAMASTASASSPYCPSNIRCSVWNIGPVTFQWKLWVFRYSVYESARTFESWPAIASRAFASMPMSISMFVLVSSEGLAGPRRGAGCVAARGPSNRFFRCRR
jgi:hypothetical protein